MASATTQKLPNSSHASSNSKTKPATLSSPPGKNIMSHSPTKSSNGNTQKSNPIKKEPIQSSSMKRKSRTLPSSDEESDDEQMVTKKVTLPTTNIIGDTLTPPAEIKVEPKATPTKITQPSTNVKSEPSTPVLKKEITPIKSDKKESKPEMTTPKRKNNASESDNHDDTIPLAKKVKNSIPAKPSPTCVKKESPGSTKSSITSAVNKTKSSRNTSPVNVKTQKTPIKTETKVSSSSSTTKPNTSGKRKKKEEEEIWRWWEDEPYTDGVKWKTLEHNGPLFPEPYEPLPKNVKFFYNGTEVRLNPDAEEIMTFYARMLDHDYTSKPVFNKNFMKDWHKVMKPSERELIKDIRKCDFKQVAAYFKEQSEKKKAMTKEEKKEKKEENERTRQIYGFCMWDKHRQPVGNYKIEPPGLFRGRGEHPKMGCVKGRIVPEDVIINIGRDAKIPKAPEGHKWKEIRHDNKVSWLVTWTENIRGNNKYIMLNASSRVKGERDWQKYEKARKLHRVIDKIRENYQNDWKHKEMRIRQRAVALYFIDKLALRVGNEKDEDEADTVGCCSLRVEHIQLHDRFEGVGEHVVEFDFLGKDSIRYNKKVSVEPRVYKNLKLCMENKEKNDELFDRLTTTSLNQYLSELMDGLTAKVFRTYNASKTLQEQLEKLTEPKADVNEKILSYNRANREVALLCNHQRSVPKNFEKSMEALKTKIDAKKDEVSDIKNELKRAKAEHKSSRNQTSQKKVEQTEKKLQRAEEALKKLEGQAVDRNENKDVALGTSKLNYLDPRITVAWCKKWKVPVEKIYSKTQRDKFRWAIDMATADYHFYNYEGEIVLRQVDESNNNEDGDGDDEDEEQDQNSNDD